MDLCEARIGHRGAALVRAPDSGAVGTFRVGGKIEDVAVSAGSQDDGIGDVRVHLSGDKVSSNDTARFSIDDNQVQHLRARIHLDAACVDLTLESLICAEQKLLARLSARIKGSRNLRAAERTI